MRTDYRYAVQLNRSTTLVSRAFVFAIVLKYKYKTFAHCHFSHMFSWRSHLRNLLRCSYFKRDFFLLLASWLKGATLSTERKKLQVCRSTTMLPTQTETTVLLCTPLQPAGEQIKKLSLQNKWSLPSNFFSSFQMNYRPWFEAALFFFATDLRAYWNSISARVITLKRRAEQFGGRMYWRFCSIMSLATGLGEVSSSGSLQ